MTTQTHTPGPWTRQPDQRFRNDQSAGVKGPNGLYIAAALDFNRTDRDAEVEANAHLIAAAPDLLTALKLLMSKVDHGDYPRRCDPASMVGSVLGGNDLVTARNAIAKAEGRQP